MPSKPPVALFDMSLFQNLDRKALEDLGCVYYRCVFTVKEFTMLIPAALYDRIPNGARLVTTSGTYFMFERNRLSDTSTINTICLGHIRYLQYGFPVPNVTEEPAGSSEPWKPGE